MKVVVAGGTGFVGRAIVRQLLDGDHRVTVLGRDPAKVGSMRELLGANSVRGDVTDPASLVGSLEGADAVVNAAQFPNHPVEVPRKGMTYDRYDRGGTENLIAEAKRSGVERFIYMSGAGAEPASDRTWYRAKGLAERALRESGLEWVALRPSWAYGPGDRAINRLAKIARFSPVLPRLGVRVQRIQPVYVGDIALAVSGVLETPEAWNRVFELGGPEILTMDQVMHTMLAVLGKKRLVVPIPAPLAKLGTAPLVLTPKPFMTPGGIEFAVQEGVVDTTDAEKILGLRFVPLEDGLRRYELGG
jgi:uncharacterized protein YbjT (DUF2867 family)